MIIALAKKDYYPLYKAWQYLMRTRFKVLEAGSASSSKFELVDLTTPAVAMMFLIWSRLLVKGTPGVL
jgi:hypothetical protein